MYRERLILIRKKRWILMLWLRVMQAEDTSASTSNGPSDISKTREDPPMQPNLKIFPRTLTEDRRRSFKAACQSVSAYCYACRHFSQPKTTDTVFDAPSGYKKWKKATYSFSIHAKSERHKPAWRDYQISVTTNATLANALNKDNRRSATT